MKTAIITLFILVGVLFYSIILLINNDRVFVHLFDEQVQINQKLYEDFKSVDNTIKIQLPEGYQLDNRTVR